MYIWACADKRNYDLHKHTLVSLVVLQNLLMLYNKKWDVLRIQQMVLHKYFLGSVNLDILVIDFC